MAEERKHPPEEKDERNIYEKMTAVKMKLIGIKKSGVNEFSNYTYFELGDILPVLTPALQEERLFMQTVFSTTDLIAKLIITDIDNPESKLEFETKVGSCTLKASHDIQNYGAAQTYTRRYLIMTAFDIAEADIVDGGAEREEKKPEQKQKTQQQQPPKPQQKPPAKTTTTPDKLAPLKRAAWELIKKLPIEKDRTDWLNKCTDAGEEALKEIINQLHEIISPKQPPKEETEEHKKRVEELKDKLLTLIEKLPTEEQKGWFETTQNSNSINELCDFHSQLMKITKAAETTQQPPKTEPTSPQDKPATKPVNPQELDIY